MATHGGELVIDQDSSGRYCWAIIFDDGQRMQSGYTYLNESAARVAARNWWLTSLRERDGD